MLEKEEKQHGQKLSRIHFHLYANREEFTH